MIDALKTDLVFYPLQFSRNRMEWLIGSANTSLTSRAGLKYFLSLLTPNYPGSSTFTEITTLEGREKPPVVIGSSTTFEGAYFRIDEILDGLLTRQKPTFAQTTPTILTTLTIPYKLRERIQGGTPTQNTDLTRPTQWLFKGGVREEDSPWMERFFNEYLKDNRSFLSWQPTTKTVSLAQEEYLYFLFNFAPPTTVKLRIQINWLDGSTLIRDGYTLSNIPIYSVINCPVGPVALGLTSGVASYSVWLANGSDERLSEVRTFTLDQRYRAQERFLLFNNSLSGYDTLRLTGQGEETLVTQRSTAQVDTFGQIGAEVAELKIIDIQGDRQLTVSTGWFERNGGLWADYLSELLFTEEMFLITDKGHISVMLSNTELKVSDDNADLVARTFTLERTKADRSYSRLPYALPRSNRPVGWAAYPAVPILDGFGKRTGYEQPVRLRKIYTDTNTDFFPITEKPNVAGDPDYVAPTVMSGVTPGSTPYPSTAISRTGSYSRSNCAANRRGGPATIVVTAGKYGGETLADANARAEAEFSALDTQAYADTNGTCTLMTYQSAEISRFGSFNRIGCTASRIGGPASIEIAAGKYGSDISQYDADQKAETEFNSLNTQAYANANGSCTYQSLIMQSVVVSGSSPKTVSWSIIQNQGDTIQFRVDLTATGSSYGAWTNGTSFTTTASGSVWVQIRSLLSGSVIQFNGANWLLTV